MTFPAATRFVDFVSPDPQFQQVAPTRSGSAPLFPMIQPDAPANPPVQFSDFAKRDSRFVVMKRATEVGCEIRDHCRWRVASRSFRDLLHFRLELLLAFRRPTHFAPHDPESEEARLSEFYYAALRLVDDELELVREERSDAPQNPLSSTLAAAEDDEVVGVSHEFVPSLFELIV